MKIKFYKYQGAGNDFVMIDNRKGQFDKDNLQLVRKLCDRRFGVGADGLILIENHSDLDFNMIYFNSDGSQSFCGNGSRCAISFAHFLGMIKENCMFNSTDGTHEGVFKNQSEVHLHMHDVQEIEVGENYFYLNTGSPHYISFVKNVNEINIVEEAREIRYNNRFKEIGTNVNYVEIKNESNLKIRTYERGVEDETLACGTGVTAAVLAFCNDNPSSKEIFVEAMGGSLRVSFDREGNTFKNIWLIGGGEYVYEGEINV